MADNKEYKLAIKIAGAVEKSLEDATGKTKKELRALAREAALSSMKIDTSLSGALDSLRDPVDAVCNGAVSAVKATAAAATAAAAAATAIGTAAISAGSEFESAFAGVRKTVNATEAEFGEIEAEIRQMAKDKPQTAVELSEIAEAAGQLGIQTENIVGFTETMADLKEATNLGDDGASELAQFANITGMSQTKFSNLGSTIVALGNNLATTESDIMSMGMRLAGAGTQVGMTEAQILGLSGALSSVGIEAEAGGSAASKLMVNMQLAAETGGESLQDFARVANMSAGEFRKKFKEDAAGALTAFISGLNDTDRLGKSAIATLDDMGITEVRLRDTLLRAAGASDLFEESLQLASSSFEENTALAKEAAERYKTFESRVGMVKNRVTDAGITIYEDFQEPVSQALGVVLDFSDELGMLDASKIDDLADRAQSAIPTVVREFKDGASAVLELVDPIVSLGGIAADNLDVIAGGLAGVGTAIVGFKLVDNLVKTGKAVSGVMTALKLSMVANPWTPVIVGVAALGAAFVGIRTKMKVTAEQMKRDSLAEHFGDISLSVDDLREAAETIIGQKSIEKVSAAMEELGKVSDIADTLSGASKTINRMTWKVDAGVTLSGTDQEDLSSAIDTSINQSIALVEQAKYTAHINIEALYGEDSRTGESMIAGFDAMYDGIYKDVERLGNDLGEAYRNAMEDGILGTDEAALIQSLQGQLANVTDQVAQSLSEAKLSRIRAEYSGAGLDAESFQNLQAEIGEVLAEQRENVGQSYEYTVGALNTQFKRSQSGEIRQGEEGYLTQADYDSLIADAQQQLQLRRMEIGVEGLSFSADSIRDAYSSEIGGLLDGMESGLSEALEQGLQTMANGGNGALAWDKNVIQGILGIDELDNATRDAITELWENIEPDYQAMQEAAAKWVEAGKEIPESVAQAMQEASKIGAIAGSEDAIWQAMAFTAEGNPEYLSALEAAQEAGYAIPESIATGIAENQNAEINQAIDQSRNATQLYLDTQFRKFGVNSILDVSFAIQGHAANAAQIPELPGHAEGGIFDEPHVAWFAEGGHPEAVIPIDGSRNAEELWEETGQLLGMPRMDFGSALQGLFAALSSAGTGQNEGNSSTQVNYAPVFHVSGGNEDAVREAERQSREEFGRMMQQYAKDQRRVSYAG